MKQSSIILDPKHRIAFCSSKPAVSPIHSKSAIAASEGLERNASNAADCGPQ
jgi:hypothetical protein